MQFYRSLWEKTRFERVVEIISLSEKFLSFCKEIIDARRSLFYINLLNYAAT